jgi:hypothetical protein
MHFAKWERVMAYVVCLSFCFSITPVLAQTSCEPSAVGNGSIVVVASPQFIQVVDRLASSTRKVVAVQGFSEVVERDRNCSLDLLLAASLPEAIEDTVMKERLANHGVSVVVAPPPNRNCSFLSLIQWVRFVERELVSRYPEDRQHIKLRSKALQKEILSSWRKASELPANWIVASANVL